MAYVKTNSTGQIDGKWAERAFGQRLPIQEFATPYGFTGREFEEKLGLNFHRARFYDPGIGRFISRDPVFGDIGNPITQHPYLYGNLNPYRYSDPDGRLAFGLIDAGEDEATWAARHYSAEYARSGGVGNLLMGLATSAWSDDTASTLSATTLISGGVAIGYVGGVVALEEAKTLVLTAGTTALSVVEKLKGWWNRGKIIDPNKLHHIFDKAQHQLEPLVKELGSQEIVYKTVNNAVQSVVRSQGISQGVFETTVRIGKSDVFVRGMVMKDGVFRMGSFWIP